MMRKVTRLTSFIKPSSPNETTQLKVQQNTDTWMLNNMHILREHYDSVIAVGLETIPTFNQIPFDKAIQWGRSRYGRKLTSSSVNTLRDITSKSPPTEEGASTSRLSPLDYPPLPNPVNPLLLQQFYPSPSPTSVPLTTTSPTTLSSPPSLTSPTPALKTQTPPTSPSPPLLTPSSLPLSSLLLLAPRRDLCTPSEGVGASDVATPPGTHLLHRNPQLIVKAETHPLPPRESNRLRALRAERRIVSPAPSSLSPSHTAATHPPQTHYSNVALPCSNTISSFPIDTPHQQREPDQVAAESANTTAVTEAGNKNMRRTGDIKSVTLTLPPPSDLPASSTSSNSAVPPGSPGRPEPHSHPHTFRKIQEWSLEVRRTTLVIGDSNLSRIPKFTHPHIQVDSYPGANFHHINAILTKLTPHPQPLHVILSVGLNNCLSEHETNTILKQLRTLWRTAHLTFPNATIYIPIINFSPSLNPQKQALLNFLNTTISSKYNFLSEINPLLFQVTGDNIHWTPQTAEMLFGYWKQQLNL